MQRVMIVGQPGAGKSTIARQIGKITGLPVVHIDQIHWQPGWVERDRAEKTRLCQEVHAREQWIFEGGHSATWAERLERADTFIWIDLPLGLRYRRVFWRMLRHWGQSRPDLPEDCPEQFSWEFYRWIWDTRHSARRGAQRCLDKADGGTRTYHLQSPAAVAQFLDQLAAEHGTKVPARR